MDDVVHHAFALFPLGRVRLLSFTLVRLEKGLLEALSVFLEALAFSHSRAGRAKKTGIAPQIQVVAGKVMYSRQATEAALINMELVV